MAYLKCILFLQLLCQTGDGHVAGRGSPAPPSEDQAQDVGGDGGEEDDDDFETRVGKRQKRQKNSTSTHPLAPSQKPSVVAGEMAAPEPG